MLSFCCLQALSGFPRCCVMCSHPKRSTLLFKNFSFLQTYQHAKADVENLQRRKNLLIINTVNSNASWGCSLKTQYSVKKREDLGSFLPARQQVRLSFSGDRGEDEQVVTHDMRNAQKPSSLVPTRQEDILTYTCLQYKKTAWS